MAHTRCATQSALRPLVVCRAGLGTFLGVKVQPESSSGGAVLPGELNRADALEALTEGAAR